MEDLDKITRQAFESMTDEEKYKIIEELKKNLGDSSIDIKLYCPSEVSKWWDDTLKDGKGVSFNLLMSHFFLAMLNSAFALPSKEFNERASCSLQVLTGNVGLESEVQCNEDVSKKTFH